MGKALEKKKALEELKQFWTNLQKPSRVGFRIEGKGNILYNNYAEGFDVGYDITGDDNILIDNEANGPNKEQIAKSYHYIMAEIDRENTDRSRLQKIYGELKDWAPTIALVVLKILTKFNIL